MKVLMILGLQQSELSGLPCWKEAAGPESAPETGSIFL
jgi:hypothetical protein